MLARARPRPLRASRLRVPVADIEALIGLKLQAIVNEPSRVQDAADIRALIAAAPKALNHPLLRDYYRLFDREDELDRCSPRRRGANFQSLEAENGLDRRKRRSEPRESPSAEGSAGSRRVSRVPPPIPYDVRSRRATAAADERRPLPSLMPRNSHAAASAGRRAWHVGGHQLGPGRCLTPRWRSFCQRPSLDPSPARTPRARCPPSPLRTRTSCDDRRPPPPSRRPASRR